MDWTWLDRSYVVDWGLTFTWFLLSGLLKQLPVFERDFDPHDPLISHKFRQDQVNGFMLHVLSDGIPIAVVILVAGLLRRSLFELHHGLLAFLASSNLQRVIVNFLKNIVGRLRPDFLDRCQWNGTECTGKARIVLDGHRSFPSGHSSAAWVGMTFLFLYFADKTDCFRSRPTFASRSWTGSVLLRITLTISPLFLSAWIAITRLEDYRHHKEDVIVGSIIGFITAWLIFRIYFPDPFAAVPSGEAGGDPRTLYGPERQRDDGFMELSQLPEERGLARESPGENQV